MCGLTCVVLAVVGWCMLSMGVGACSVLLISLAFEHCVLRATFDPH